MSAFSNQGLHAAEALFTGAHERAAQYLEQAPILVMWALPWADFRNDGGQTFAAHWIAGKCIAGVPLKEFLRSVGFSPPMRAIRASVLQPSHAGVYQMLSRVPPAVLGRAIPATAVAQRRWLRALGVWLGTKRNRYAFDTDGMFQWCVERLSGAEISRDQARDMLDFQMNSRDFNKAWGLKRATEEMGGWHARITLESQIRQLPVQPDDAIDLGGLPEIWTCERYAIQPLRTPREIADEGSAMRHCAATYIKWVFDGRSHLASVTSGGKRVATLELAGPKAGARRFSVVQLRGPCNSAVPPTVMAFASLYSELLKSRPDPNARSAP